MPSIVSPNSSAIYSKLFPSAIPLPHLLFRLSFDVHVSIKSPIPLSPTDVSGFPPIAFRNNLNSLNPLTIKAAIVEFP